jgi:signal transduction histidine kinase
MAGQPALTLRTDTTSINLAPSVQVYKDASGTQTLNEILSPSIQAQFDAAPAGQNAELNFGFTDATYWIKFTLERTPQAPTNWILEIPYLSLNSIRLYTSGNPPLEVGTDYSAALKPIFYPLYALPVLPATTPQDYYLEVRSSYALSVPMTLWSSAAFSHQFANSLFIQALYFGSLLSLAIYNFLLFLSLRERSFLVYSGFAIVMGLAMFAGNGFGRLYFWPDAPSWDNISQMTFFSFAGALGLLFSASFLRTKQTAPRLNRLLMGLAALYLLSAALLVSSLWGYAPVSLGFQLILIATIPGTIGAITAGAKALRAGNRSALYFLLAWGILMVAANVAVLRAFDLIATNSLTLYAVQIGSCLEMLLLSFALAHRIQTERDQRIAAQEQAFRAHDALLNIAQENEAILERKVKERTNLLQQLAFNEKQIRQEYARFGAMISHEFRNPLGIIETQATLIQRETPRGIQKAEERSEIILSATQRLARLFEQWIKSDQLQQSISLMHPAPISLAGLFEPILETARGMHRSHSIQMPKLPNRMLTVDSALIEIALLNLIDNACKYSPPTAPISIRCESLDGMIGISIEDQGPGLPISKQATIFQPYVRAAHKNEPTGYGLGLAFVAHIAELHQGKIDLVSPPGGGCKFTLWLPFSD